MKLLHTADWHLGKRLERFDRNDEQRAVLDEICEIANREAVDAVLIAGDLYDTFNPPIEATSNFYQHLKRLSAGGRRPVIAIAGNHDSPHRIEAPDPLARESGILLVGYPHSELSPMKLDTGLEILRSAPGFIELSLPTAPEYPLRLILTPYANEARMRKSLGIDAPEAELRRLLQAGWGNIADEFCDEKGINLLMAHLFMIGKGQPVPEEPEDEKPINIGGASAIFTENVPKQVQYVALGHLHRCQNMGGGPCPCVYSGSPLGYSFSEAGQQKQVVIIEAEPGKSVDWRKISLEKGFPLTRKEFEDHDMDAAVTWLQENQDFFVELYIRTDRYLDAADRKRLMEAHPRIIGPIPRFRDPLALGEHASRAADPGKGREELFKDYFKYRQGLDASEEMMALFREVIGKEAGA